MAWKTGDRVVIEGPKGSQYEGKDRVGTIVGWTYGCKDVGLASDESSEDNAESIMGGETWCWPTLDGARAAAEAECLDIYFDEHPMPDPKWTEDGRELEWVIEKGTLAYKVYPIVLYDGD